MTIQGTEIGLRSKPVCRAGPKVPHNKSTGVKGGRRRAGSERALVTGIAGRVEGGVLFECCEREGRRHAMRLNLVGFGGSVRDTGLVGDPVDFPSLAPIGGEGLLKVGGIGRGLGPNIANQNDPAVERLLVEKFATAVGKLANRRLPERTVLAVGPVETPLMGLRIVETEGQTLDVTGRAGGLELFEPSAAIPDFAGDGSAVKLNPGRRAGQGME